MEIIKRKVKEISPPQKKSFNKDGRTIDFKQAFVKFENDDRSYSASTLNFKDGFDKAFDIGKEISVCVKPSKVGDNTYYNLSPVTNAARDQASLIDTLKSIEALLAMQVFYKSNGIKKSEDDGIEELKKAYTRLKNK